MNRRLGLVSIVLFVRWRPATYHPPFLPKSGERRSRSSALRAKPETNDERDGLTNACERPAALHVD
jgi:hypothetical protein